MKKNIKTLGLVALTVGAFAPCLAHAQSDTAAPTSAYQAGDLLVGFYNSTNEYVLDLGPLSNFNLASTFTIPEATTQMGTDLTTQFSSGWHSSSSVYWGLVATTYPTVFVSDPAGNAAWSSAGTEGAVDSTIANFAGDTYNPWANYTDTGATQNSVQGASVGLLEPSSDSESWKSFFGNVSGGAIEGNFTDGGAKFGDGSISSTPTGSNAFDQLNNSTGEKTVGTWTVDGAGDLTYTAAVPEPSTWASIVLGAFALIGIRRRRA
jgi:hypothetical protein